MIYTPGMLRKTLADYQRRAQGARMRPPEDRLVSRSAPLEEAPWANTSCLWSDIEQAMRALPFERMQILFMTVCLGESSWRNGMKRYDWRTKVADWWGRTSRNGGGRDSTMTPGDVNKVVDESIKEMCDSLNGVAVSNG
jgi:hypothetical protein